MRRLMGHLAQFSSFSNQGELLCTQGLAYLLGNPGACAAFGAHISEQVGVTVGSDLVWKPEVRQPDGRRCDLQACTADKRFMAKVEAKLGAELREGQLVSYLTHLQTKPGGLLLVLVPDHRVQEMMKSVPIACGPFALSGDGPWQLHEKSDFSVAVICWEEILKAMGKVCSDSFADDRAQFRAMYRVLIGDDIEPFTSNAELRAWREREGVFVNLVDHVTRSLTPPSQMLLPMGREGACPNDYHRRYVCRPLGTEQPCFSVGVREPFGEHITPIWLRFHHDTPMFSVIHERLVASSLSRREWDGHIWIPLDIPLNAATHRLKASLVTQAEEVIQVAYQPLP